MEGLKIITLSNGSERENIGDHHVNYETVPDISLGELQCSPLRAKADCSLVLVLMKQAVKRSKGTRNNR